MLHRWCLAIASVCFLGCSSDEFVSGDASADGAPDVAADGCTDLAFCADKCGSGLADGCGRSRDCGTCGDGQTCDGNTHKCTCARVPLAVWCTAKCGKVNDNCGIQVDCGGCDGGQCTNGSCSGCVDDGSACTNKTCGTATNNCGQTVNCGSCSGSLKCCSGTCVDTATSFANCGGCGKSCSPIQHADTCENGGCTCVGHQSNSNPASCGPCGTIGMNCIAGGRPNCTNGICF